VNWADVADEAVAVNWAAGSGHEAVAVNWAAGSGHYWAVKLLLENGGHVGYSIQIAGEKGHLEVVKLLVKYGADYASAGLPYSYDELLDHIFGREFPVPPVHTPPCEVSFALLPPREACAASDHLCKDEKCKSGAGQMNEVLEEKETFCHTGESISCYFLSVFLLVLPTMFGPNGFLKFVPSCFELILFLGSQLKLSVLVTKVFFCAFIMLHQTKVCCLVYL
jgi:hypothetical protein